MSLLERPLVLPAAGLLALVLAGGALPADVLHVPGDFPAVQSALDAAQSGDTVEVAAGDYSSNATLTFRGKGLVLRAPEGPEKTTLRLVEPLDLDRASVLTFDAAEPATSLVEGFTITGGQGSFWGPGVEEGGGGILVRGGASPTIRNCLVTGNSGWNGGGIFCDQGTAPHLESTVVTLNRGISLGGGIFFNATGPGPALESCRIYRNTASSGGGLFFYGGSSPTLRGVTIEGNFAQSVGGGLCCLQGTEAVLERCLFLGNLASGGGAFSCETSADNPVLVNCLLVANLAFSAGAVQTRSEASPQLLHCTVTGNGALDEAGGIFCRGASSPRIHGSIVVGNAPETICGDVQASFTSGNPGFLRPLEPDFERMIVLDAAGQPVEFPDFVVDAGDYHLGVGSPAIDQATGISSPPTDFDGTARPCGAAPDQGAYERCGGGPAEPQFARGDSNASGKIDLSDAVSVLGFLFLGDDAPPCFRAADMNDSGVVDLADAVYLLLYLFSEGAPLPPPTPECGEDATPDGLTCEAFAPCAA